MEPFVNFVIRPPRADYSTEDLLEPEFSIKGRTYQRKDLEITNSRGQVLQCSHYTPHALSEDTQLPCVIYCHGNSGCRADGNEAAIVLLPSNITVFTLDFSGSGLSDGDYVSLGWNEKDDLKAVVSYLRSLKQISCIGLWGRSMGAVTSLMYGAEDPSIAGMVLDSPFSNLFDLMMELVDVYKIRLPKFTVRVALQIMRRIIQKRAQFDIMDLNIAQFASKTFIPALFGHATEDIFIQPHHCDLIHQEYAGDKNIIKFEGDHNSPRPQFYHDSVTIFFHNVLCPPRILLGDRACNSVNYGSVNYGLDALQIHEELVQSAICEAVNEPIITIPESHEFDDLVMVHGMGSRREVLPQSSSPCKVNETDSSPNDLEQPMEVLELIRRVKCNEDSSEFSFGSLLEDKGDEQRVDCYSYPSSNGASTESWGRCSSHGISENSGDESPSRQNFVEAPKNMDDEEKMIMKAIAASLTDVDANETKKATTMPNCSLGNGRVRKSKLEALSRRLKLSCFRGMGRRSKGTT